jgi:MSHA biogenesis protein MshK
VQAALPDPTEPWHTAAAGTVATAASPAPYQLHAILIGAGRRQAIINGRLLHEGETLDGLRVRAIRAEGVQVEGSQGIETLRLLSSPITQPSRARP